MSDIADELRAFEGSEALGNGDFSACYRGAAEITRLRAELATARRKGMEMPSEFLQWVTREMPSGTYIHNPEWWAKKIWKAAILTDHRQEGMQGFSDLVAAAYAEAAKVMHKFPQPNYVISKIAEEAGEVVKAAIHCAEKRETVENVAAEMKQLLAMLIRLWVEGDQVHGLPPIAAEIRAAAKEGKP